jgi:hypothetical protein
VTIVTCLTSQTKIGWDQFLLVVLHYLSTWQFIHPGAEDLDAYFAFADMIIDQHDEPG